MFGLPPFGDLRPSAMVGRGPCRPQGRKTRGRTNQIPDEPQHDQREWWVEEDLNLRPHAYQACALTT